MEPPLLPAPSSPFLSLFLPSPHQGTQQNYTHTQQLQSLKHRALLTSVIAEEAEEADEDVHADVLTDTVTELAKTKVELDSLRKEIADMGKKAQRLETRLRKSEEKKKEANCLFS